MKLPSKLYINIYQIIEFILIIELLLPLFSFFSFTFINKFFNFYQYYFLINILLLFILILKLKKITTISLLFLAAILGYFLLNSLGFILQSKGLSDTLRSFTSYYFVFFLGYLLYKVYFKTGEINRLLRFFVKIGIFISIINIIHFISFFFLYNSNYFNYSYINRYLEVLNPVFNEYIKISIQEDTVGFPRHVGYFFDTHSQYFIPLLSIFVILVSEIKFKFKLITILLIVVSILLSGIKTAYLSLFIMFLFYWYRNFNYSKFIYTFLYLTLFIVLFYNQIEIVINNLLFQNHSVYSEHLLNNPMKFFNYSRIGFFLGGNPEAFDFIYTEVSFLKIWYSIGILGLIFYLLPVFLLFNKNKTILVGSFLYLGLIISFIHYGVFNNGINNFASALSFLYLLVLINSTNHHYLSSTN